jgi:exodeoxyribonuclease V alpha subunit
MQECLEMFGVLIEEKIFASIDLYFAKALTKDLDEQEKKSVLFLLAYLLLLDRNGHLCLQLKEGKLYPPASCFTSNGERESFLEEQIKKGIEQLPKKLVQEVFVGKKAAYIKPLCRFKESVYLQKNWLLEIEFVSALEKLLKESPKMALPSSLSLSPLLNAEQRKAVLESLQSSFSLIAGGPGTGKTFTAVELLRTFLDSLPEDKKNRIQIKVAAPTGKAAAHLQKNINQLLSVFSEQIECGTLHSLLGIGWNGKAKSQRKAFVADLLLVDEASMIDAKLFKELLFKMRGGGRLILMGDPHQLPPVESGGFFADLIALAPDLELPCTLLKECLRTEKKELLEFAKAFILEEKTKILTSPFVHFFKPEDPKSVLEQAWQKAKEFFDPEVSCLEDPDLYLKKMDRFRILSCLRKGLLGVESLNAFLLKRFLEGLKEEDLLAVPILIQSNEHSLALMNGDTGVLIAKVSSLKAGYYTSEDTAYFPNKEEGGASRKLSALLLPSFELGYALSVHKSQGSEYDSVLVIAPSGSEAFGKEVLYTAVTRAKKELVLLTEKEVLSCLIGKSSKKNSGLASIHFALQSAIDT